MNAKKIVFLSFAAVALVAFGGAPDVVLNGFAVGKVRLMCRERNGWKVDFRRETDGSGVEYAVVEMTREKPDYPAPFNLSFNFPKKDIAAAWRPWNGASGFGMYWNPAHLPAAGETNFRKHAPIYACYGSGGMNRMTFAASESSEPLWIKAGIREEDVRLYFAFHFYDMKVAKRTKLTAKLRIDSRDVFWSDAVQEASGWMTAVSGRIPAKVPEAAFAPLYSTWYNFHQNVFQDEIERECALASKMGMKTIIVDDGWQTDDTNRGYAYCGDWEVSKRRFPDMAAHVARVQAMGMKYMLWYSVPFVGKHAKVCERFKGKYLYYRNASGAYCLDPRFPEVREYLISIYERAVKEWNIDGVKLDFVNSIVIDGKDPAIKDGFAGRDIKDLGLATERLLADAYARLSAIKPDILVEFRQPYIGPAIRSAANMLRVGDCPADMLVNRRGIVNLRLTSGGTAVHADMLEWHPSNSPEAAAKNVLSVIFSTVQYSMKLSGLSPRHFAMISHWSRFGAEHVDALQRGKFKAYHPELSYPLLEGESEKKRIFAVYAEEMVVHAGELNKPVYILNSTDASSLVVDIPSAAIAESYDTFGKLKESRTFNGGVNRMPVPPSGYVLIKSSRIAKDNR